MMKLLRIPVPGRRSFQPRLIDLDSEPRRIGEDEPGPIENDLDREQVAVVEAEILRGRLADLQTLAARRRRELAGQLNSRPSRTRTRWPQQ